MEAALETSEATELLDAAVVTSVASVDLQWSHPGSRVEDVGGVKVVSSAVKHSVSASVQSLCAKNFVHVVSLFPTLTGPSRPFWMVVSESFQTSTCVRRPCVCARGPQGTVVVP